jgi:predicted alpha/beta-hydrolase family hydrolase
MDTPFMQAFALGLANRGMRFHDHEMRGMRFRDHEMRGLRVVRFEFPYMAQRRTTGKQRPPDREPILLDAWRHVIEALGPKRLVIGGKSMGGRIASMVADETQPAGLVCLGYPFHPTGQPERLRVEHLKGLKTPALILQGTRDPFGSQDEVAGYKLSPAIKLHWLADGDHDFKPRRASGKSQQENWDEAMNAIVQFVGSLSP